MKTEPNLFLDGFLMGAGFVIALVSIVMSLRVIF